MKKHLLLPLIICLGLNACDDDAGNVAKLAYNTYAEGHYIGQSQPGNTSFSQARPLLSQEQFITYFECLAQRNAEHWEEKALTHLPNETDEGQNPQNHWLRTLSYCCPTTTQPSTPSLSALHDVYDWSQQSVLDKVEGTSLALDFPALLEAAITSAIRFREFEYQSPNDYLLQIPIPTDLFKPLLDFKQESHKKLWQNLKNQSQWSYESLSTLLEAEELDPASWIHSAMTASLCSEQSVLTQENIKGDLAKPWRIYTERFACLNIAEATLNGMMMSLRQGLCITEELNSVVEESDPAQSHSF